MPNDLTYALVGRRVQVWWDYDQCFFAGVVELFHIDRGHKIRYDDKKVKWHKLHEDAETWKFEEDDPDESPLQLDTEAHPDTSDQVCTYVGRQMGYERE